MMLNRGSTGVPFTLRFYEQTTEAVVAVIENARRSHPGITAATHANDSAPSRPCTVVTLRFRDQDALGAFMRDDQFIEAYLQNAWGRGALPRASLRVFGAEELETIPSDLFTQAEL